MTKLELDKVKLSVNSANSEINSIGNYLRSNNLELSGLPYKNNKDCETAVQKVLSHINPSISSSYYKCFEQGSIENESSTRTKPILIKFDSLQTRHNLFKNKKLLRNIETIELGIADSNLKIFLNENLCPSSKMLFGKANRERKAKEYKFIWTSSGTIWVRKNIDTNAIAIKTEKDINHTLTRYLDTFLIFPEKLFYSI